MLPEIAPPNSNRIPDGTDSGCKEVSGEFVVAGSDAPPVFDAAEVIFDFVSLPIKALGTIGFPGGVASAGDDRQSAFILDLLAYFRAAA